MTKGDDLGLNVSRETIARLVEFEALVRKWTQKINLVSKATIDDIWDRHIVDSAQFCQYLPEKCVSFTDIGSGGGFPGVVLAAVLKETHPEAQVTLIESDTRKCAFLRNAARELELNATVLNERIEAAEPQDSDILTARALAPLHNLLPLVARHLSKDGTALLAKGQNWEQEIEEAQEKWAFRHIVHPSKTQKEAVILEVGEIRNA